MDIIQAIPWTRFAASLGALSPTDVKLLAEWMRRTQSSPYHMQILPCFGPLAAYDACRSHAAHQTATRHWTTQSSKGVAGTLDVDYPRRSSLEALDIRRNMR